jgi:hypothetical protein
VTTLASWNSLKLPIRDCIRWLIPTTARQTDSQDEEGGDERKIRGDRDMQEEEGGDRSGGRVPPRRSRWGRPPLWLAAGGPDGRGWRGGKNLSCCCIVSGWPPLEPSSAPLLVCPLGHETPDASTCVGFSAVFGPFPFRSFFLLFFC